MDEYSNKPILTEYHVTTSDVAASLAFTALIAWLLLVAIIQERQPLPQPETISAIRELYCGKARP